MILVYVLLFFAIVFALDAWGDKYAPISPAVFCGVGAAVVYWGLPQC